MARKPSKATVVRRLLYRVPDARKAEASSIIEEILAIQEKLDEIRPAFSAEPVSVEYDNGGGQSGVRENPTHIAYQKLLRSYLQALKALDDLREEDAEEAALIGVLDW